ncbi:MAG: glycoside hydrolase family 66 protein [Gaiellaceae bacterium]
MTELLPAKATFAPGEAIEVEVRGGSPAVSLWHLERKVAEATSANGVARFDAQPEGGYGIEGGGATTAVDVLADPLRRPRYGFVARYDHGRDVEGVVENVRRLHLNAVQFYDWMYRHADLLPPEDEFTDALGQTVSLDTVRRLAGGIAAAGSLTMGYAAVYAVGREAWPEWEDAGLFRSDGTPWMLGDFLWNVDPTDDRWISHFAEDLRAALGVGFAGFHLDQYGAPKRALRKDGTEVDLADAFPALLERLATEVPQARMLFNNVNDFPTWTTARATQSATYIEVWAPHVRLGHLGDLVTKARSYAPERAVILAAYLSAYRGDEAGARAAERLQHAVVFSHGGTVLLHGEEHSVLTEAYYVRNRAISPESQDSARRMYDFAVRYGDLLFDRGSVDVTRTMLAGENLDVRVEAPVPVSTDCRPGVLWARVLRSTHGLLISLIDLSAQDDDVWDSPKAPFEPLPAVRVAVERVRRGAPSFHFADPDDSPGLASLESTFDGSHDVVELPAFAPWALLLVRDGDE